MQADFESFWRSVDNVNKTFTDAEKYSDILAESSNLNKTKKVHEVAQLKNLSASWLCMISLSSFQRRWTEILDGKVWKLFSRYKNWCHFQVVWVLIWQAHIPETNRVFCSTAYNTGHHAENICGGNPALEVLYHKLFRLNEHFKKVKRSPSFKI